jgi:hypothetical protein
VEIGFFTRAGNSSTSHPDPGHFRANKLWQAKKLSAWDGGKVALVEDFAMVKFVTGDQVSESKNCNRISIGHAAA